MPPPGFLPSLSEYPLGFDHGEPLPSVAVRLDGGLHAVVGLHRLKPQSVMGEPVFGVVDENADQLLLVHLPENPGPCVELPFFRHGSPIVFMGYERSKNIREENLLSAALPRGPLPPPPARSPRWRGA